MTGTLVVAIYGATSGTIGIGLSLLGRRDVVWGRRAKSAGLRTHLVALRETLSESKARPEKAAEIVGGVTPRAHLQAIGEAAPACSDRRLKRLLGAVNSAYLETGKAVPVDPRTQVSFALQLAIDQALKEASLALNRLDRIERKSPR